MKTTPVTLRSAWRLGGLTPFELARRVALRFDRDEVSNRAAALSFYFLFSLFPLLIVLTALFGLFSAPELMTSLMSYADRVLPKDAAALLRATLHEIGAGARGGFVSAGLAASLWTATSGMDSLIIALGKAFETAAPRTWWRRRLTAFGLTIAFSLMALIALLLVGFGGLLGEYAASEMGFGSPFRAGWNLVQWTLAPLAALGAVGLVYRFGTAGSLRRPLATPGAAFAVLTWLAASYGLRAYVGNATRYNAIYGSMGAVVVLLLWLYLSALSVLGGAEIDAEIEQAAKGSGKT